MKALVYVISIAITLLLVSQYVPGILVESFYTALVVVVRLHCYQLSLCAAQYTCGTYIYYICRDIP